MTAQNQIDPILFALPAFFVLIGVELWAGRRRGLRLYRLNDTLANLHLGAGLVLLSALLKAPLLALYDAVHQEVGLRWWDSSSVGAWALGALLMDLAYYWLHRLSHEINFLWAAHAVHHQSEEYNLSVALRQSWVQFIYAGFFYLPLAALGVPAGPFFLLNALNTLYQFWIHTRLVDRLGPLEWVLNTPSHHRAHHGVDDEYVDRNYAGVLIVWDRLFGTFAPEGRAPRYGVIKPLRAWSAARANLDVWAQVARRAAAAPGWGARLGRAWRLLIRAPAHVDPGEEARGDGPLRTDEGYALYDARGPLTPYAALMGAASLLSGLWVIAAAPAATYAASSAGVVPWALWGWVGAHLLAGVTLGALMDGRGWARWVEAARLLCVVALCAWAPL